MSNPRVEGRANVFGRHGERNKAGLGIADRNPINPPQEIFRPNQKANPTVDGIPSDELDQFRRIIHEEEKMLRRTAVPRESYNNLMPPTIYNVPHELADGNKGAYTPVAVCIGPIVVKDDQKHRAAHEYKRKCTRFIVGNHQDQATWTDVEQLRVRSCLEALGRLRPRIRASYDDLTWIKAPYIYSLAGKLEVEMLHDGCFLLHRLLKHARIARRRAEQGTGTGGDDDNDDDDNDDDWTLVFGRCWMWGFITYDLLLLENQIPFFVLQELRQLLERPSDEGEDVLVTGALELFRPLHPNRQHTRPIACGQVHHLLHLFYLSISFPTPTPTPTPGELRASTRRHLLPLELPLWVPCAKELEEAGVKFRARKSGAESFLDVRFLSGVLEIPPLRLYDYSESLFRNLIAFEQTYPGTPGHITAYTAFMACLVTTCCPRGHAAPAPERDTGEPDEQRRSEGRRSLLQPRLRARPYLNRPQLPRRRHGRGRQVPERKVAPLAGLPGAQLLQQPVGDNLGGRRCVLAMPHRGADLLCCLCLLQAAPKLVTAAICFSEGPSCNSPHRSNNCLTYIVAHVLITCIG